MRPIKLGFIVLISATVLGCQQQHPLTGKEVEIKTGASVLVCKELSQMKKLFTMAQESIKSGSPDEGLTYATELVDAGQAWKMKPTQRATIVGITDMESIGGVDIQFAKLDSGNWILYRESEPTFDIVD